MAIGYTPRKKEKDVDCTHIWKLYQAGKSYLSSENLFDRVEECHNMCLGDQWKGLKSGDARPAQLNVLLPIMKTATALVGQNNLNIYYSPMNLGAERKRLMSVCEKLNNHALKTWEHLKMDTMLWRVLQDAYIGGDSFVYFYDNDGEIAVDQVDTTNIMFADEQNPTLQEQPYILIVQRRQVEDVKEEGKANGLNEAELAGIVPDDDTYGQINGETEVSLSKKCLCVMKLWKEDGVVWFAKTTKNVIYVPPTKIDGLTLYPIAGYTWKPMKGKARGVGDVWDKIPNQLSINKNLYRFESAVKTSAFPHKVYDAAAINATEVKKLSYPDSNIAVRDSSGKGVANLLSYLQPANISPYARDIWLEIINLTRDLSGSGDNLVNVNPEQASGSAIMAARSAKELNVNMQMAAYKQFVEDIALIWYDMWQAYNPDGLVIEKVSDDGNDRLEVIGVIMTDDEDIFSETISPEDMRTMRISVRIDVTAADAYSRAAQDASLKELFFNNVISFEEYVYALDDTSTMPKDKLTEILEERKEREQREKQLAMKIAELTSALQETRAEVDYLNGQKEQSDAQSKAAAAKMVDLSTALQQRQAEGQLEEGQQAEEQQAPLQQYEAEINDRF